MRGIGPTLLSLKVITSSDIWHRTIEPDVTDIGRTSRDLAGGEPGSSPWHQTHQCKNNKIRQLSTVPTGRSYEQTTLSISRKPELATQSQIDVVHSHTTLFFIDFQPNFNLITTFRSFLSQLTNAPVEKKWIKFDDFRKEKNLKVKLYKTKHFGKIDSASFTIHWLACFSHSLSLSLPLLSYFLYR